MPAPMTFAKFLDRATQVHGQKYEYDEDSWTNFSGRIRFRCSEHGWITQWAHVHLRTQCAYCARSSLHFDQFVELARAKHGDKFSYHAHSWTRLRDRVMITCPTHGIFEQYAHNHLKSVHGCGQCAEDATESQYEKLIRDFLCELGVPFEKEWSVDELRSAHNRKLRFDFAILPYHFVIEFDGPQHFSPVAWFGESEDEALKNFLALQANDELKNQWIAENEWQILRLTTDSDIKTEILAALTK